MKAVHRYPGQTAFSDQPQQRHNHVMGLNSPIILAPSCENPDVSGIGVIRLAIYCGSAVSAKSGQRLGNMAMHLSRIPLM